MSSHPVIDADGHIIEDKEKLRSYLEPPYNRRGGSSSGGGALGRTSSRNSAAQ